MAINASEKFLAAILGNLNNHKIIIKREIKDLGTIISITKNIKGCIFLEYLQKNNCLVNIEALQYEYDNGLIYLVIDVMHKELDSDDLRSKRIIALTTDYEKPALTSLIINQNDIAIEEFILKTSPSAQNLSKLKKNIAIQETTIYVAGASNNCGSVFTKYKHIPTGSLMIEKYKQYYPVSNHEKEVTDLIRLCGYGTRELEIMYHESVPIYAQISNTYKVEMANLNPNSSLDAKKVVDTINLEVDLIVDTITSLITTNTKKQQYIKKK